MCVNAVPSFGKLFQCELAQKTWDPVLIHQQNMARVEMTAENSGRLFSKVGRIPKLGGDIVACGNRRVGFDNFEAWKGEPVGLHEERGGMNVIHPCTVWDSRKLKGVGHIKCIGMRDKCGHKKRVQHGQLALLKIQPIFLFFLGNVFNPE